MTNHFRTLLLNLAPGTAAEHIPASFSPRVLAPKLANFYNLLFPVNSSRAAKLNLAQAYLELINGAGLDAVFTAVDDRITYDLNTDFQNFKTPSFAFTTLYSRLVGSPGIVTDMLSVAKQVDDDSYDNIWQQHPNTAYKVAGLIAAYVIRLK